MKLDDLPKEMLRKIAGFLTPEEANKNLNLCNKVFHEAINSQEMWEIYSYIYFPDVLPPVEQIKNKGYISGESFFKKCLIERKNFINEICNSDCSVSKFCWSFVGIKLDGNINSKDDLHRNIIKGLNNVSEWNGDLLRGFIWTTKEEVFNSPDYYELTSSLRPKKIVCVKIDIRKGIITEFEVTQNTDEEAVKIQPPIRLQNGHLRKIATMHVGFDNKLRESNWKTWDPGKNNSLNGCNTSKKCIIS